MFFLIDIGKIFKNLVFSQPVNRFIIMELNVLDANGIKIILSLFMNRLNFSIP